eukprot:scaffold524_cov357-Pavlova_lutheri.AAC.26
MISLTTSQEGPCFQWIICKIARQVVCLEPGHSQSLAAATSERYCPSQKLNAYPEMALAGPTMRTLAAENPFLHPPD